MIGWIRRRWQASRAPQGAPAWRKGPSGAIPITPKARRRQRLGTARMNANRWSAKLERALIAGLASAVVMLAIVFLASFVGSWLWALYEGKATGQAVLQAILSAAAVLVWLSLSHQRYHRHTRRAIADERAASLRADNQEEPRGRGPGVGDPHPSDPTPTTPIKPPDDITTNWPPDPRTNFERDFDQHKGIKGVDDWPPPRG